MVRTREGGRGHRRSHEESNHEPVGERSEDGTVTAVAEGLPEGELSPQLTEMDDTRERQKR